MSVRVMEDLCWSVCGWPVRGLSSVGLLDYVFLCGTIARG